MSGLIEEDAWMNGRTKRAGNEGGKERQSEQNNRPKHTHENHKHVGEVR